MPDATRPKGARERRNERLEAQLRSNLKRRKDQARSRTQEPQGGEDTLDADAAPANPAPNGRDANE